MNFICSITHTLIKKNDNVRVFFLESHNDPVFPFMNYNQPEAIGHFKPLGVAFKAKFEDNDHNEYFTFDLDKKNSPIVSTLLDYINEKLLTKEDAVKNNLISHNSKEINWNKIDSLEELYNRSRDQSVYLSKTYKDVFPFISVMVMHESAYQLMIKHADFENALKKLKKLQLKNDFIEHQEFIKNILNKQKKELEELRGKKHKAMKLETVIVDEEIVKECLKRIEKFKKSNDPKMVEAYNKAKKELYSEIGTEKEIRLFRERFVDQEYIDVFLTDLFKDLVGINNKENEILKEAGNSVNSQNYILSKQVESLQISNQWMESNRNYILKTYLIEFFMYQAGLEFIPSRRHYQYRTIKNKDFFQELTQLKIYK